MVEVKGDNKGININDEFQDFTGQILRGEKTIETSPRPQKRGPVEARRRQG